MFKSLISGFLSLILGITGFIQYNRKIESKFNGSFIQSWMCNYWDDETWKQEFKYMEEVGIDYLIIQSTATRTSDGEWIVYYPSDIQEFSGHCYGNVIGNALKNAKGTNIKIFIGLIEYDNWWSDAGLTDEYKLMCDVMSEMIKEIYSKYELYHENIAGWYYTPEIDNSILFKLSLLNLSNGINDILDTINTTNQSLPLLLSPFYTEYSAIPSVIETIPMWITFIDHTNFRKHDIFCPQDAIGAGWTRTKSLDNVWKMYYEAVKATDNKVKLWANCECMNCSNTGGFFNPPKTIEVENQPSPLNRFIWQMDIASKYVDNIITFSFSHYYSPLTGNNAYYEAYKYYLNNNELECDSPSTPDGIQIIKDKIIWNECRDNIGVAYYIVCLNNKDYARIEGSCNCSFTITINGLYSVYSVDGSGNKSAVSENVKVNI